MVILLVTSAFPPFGSDETGDSMLYLVQNSPYCIFAVVCNENKLTCSRFSESHGVRAACARWVCEQILDLLELTL